MKIEWDNTSEEYSGSTAWLNLPLSCKYWMCLDENRMEWLLLLYGRESIVIKHTKYCSYLSLSLVSSFHTFSYIFISDGFPHFSVKNERSQKRNLVYSHCHSWTCLWLCAYHWRNYRYVCTFFWSLTPQKCKCPRAKAFSCFAPCCIFNPSIWHLLFKTHPSGQWTNQWTMYGRCSTQVMQQVLSFTDISCWSKVYVLNAFLNICSFIYLELTICQALTVKF